MEVKPKKHPFKNLSLKWSFVVYITSCILIALALSILLSTLLNKLQHDIFSRYEELYYDELVREGDLVVDGEIMQKGVIQFYTSSLTDKFTERDVRAYNFYGFMAFMIVPIVSVICILLTGLLFFHRKLKRPLAILDRASARIADGDLDFTVSYESKNELGRLITSFESMRKSLNATNREMWHILEARKRLNAAFAHDLRTPLTVLRGYSDFLTMYVPAGKVDSEKVLSTVSLMDAYIRRLEGYTESMASMGRLEEIEPVPKEVFCGGLFPKLQSVTEQLKRDKELCFETAGKGVIFADVSIILQVLENLISNAARFAKNTVSVYCRLEGDNLIISVSDDGPGFTKEALKNAVEPYYRGDKHENDLSHFGMGLYICSVLCEKHGGGIRLENDSGAKVTAVFASLYRGRRKKLGE